MVMVEMYEPQPEPEVITLGRAEIVFKGVSLEEIGEDFAELVAMEVAALINERLTTVIGSDTGFATSGYEVSLETLTLELEGVFEGSIVARFKMIGAAVITSYGLVASYRPRDPICNRQRSGAGAIQATSGGFSPLFSYRRRNRI